MKEVILCDHLLPVCFALIWPKRQLTSRHQNTTSTVATASPPRNQNNAWWEWALNYLLNDTSDGNTQVSPGSQGTKLLFPTTPQWHEFTKAGKQWYIVQNWVSRTLGVYYMIAYLRYKTACSFFVLFLHLVRVCVCGERKFDNRDRLKRRKKKEGWWRNAECLALYNHQTNWVQQRPTDISVVQ